MTVAQGFGLFILGGFVTIAFFILWFKAMESENTDKKDNDRGYY
jgi:hypothetical protein|tara:strand:+ start:1198 stop:1329 length:132 start_codon:yes stop_codon:yes gene_type:complete